MFRCSKCGQTLPRESFRPNPKMRSGVHSWCKPCTVVRTRQWRVDHAEEYRAQKRAKYRANRAIENARRMVSFRRFHPLVEKQCPMCLQNFMPAIRNSQKYCSERCRQSYRQRIRPSVQPHIRKRVLKRDGWHCYLCNRAIPQDLKWPHDLSGTVDHVIPRSVCGHDREDNLRAAHWSCNREKADQLLGTEIWAEAA